MPRLKNLIGQKIGMLTVLQRAENGVTGSSSKVQWLCICDCGTTKIIPSAYIGVRTNSCGCLYMSSRSKAKGYSGLTRVMISYKSHAKQRGLEWSLTREQVMSLTSGNCSYCGASPSQVSKHTGIIHKRTPAAQMHGTYIYNGIDRIDNTLGYRWDNCATACGICNRAKREKTKAEFLDWIRRAYMHSISS